MIGNDLLYWLGEQTDLELSFKHSDDDDPLEGLWCVHQVRGSVNDREWHLIASGETPYDALRQARILSVYKEADQ